MEKEELDQSVGDVRGSAETFWHLDRGLKGALVMALLILAFFLAFRPTVYDVYLDAASGREIARGVFPGDGSSLPWADGAPRAGWLWWVISYGITAAGGTTAVRVFAALLVTAAVGVGVGAARKATNLAFVGVAFLVALVLSKAALLPASSAGGLFVFAALAALVANSIESSSRRMWWAVPLMVLYVNLDLSWPAGAALCIAAVVALLVARPPGRGGKILALAAAVAATTLNPDHIGAWRVLELFPVEGGSVAAWLSPMAAGIGARAGAYAFLVLGAAVAALSLSSAAFALILAAVLVAVWGLTAFTLPVFSIAVAAAIAVGFKQALENALGLAGGKVQDVGARWVGPVAAAVIDLPEAPEAALGGGGAAAGAAEAVGGGGDGRSESGRRDIWVRARVLCGLRAVISGAILVVVLVVLSRTAGGIGKWKEADAHLPVAALEFVVERGLEGSALSKPLWAGYLAWSSGGAVRPIVSTRALAASEDAAAVASWAFQRARQGGEFPGVSRLDSMGVDIVVAGMEWPRAKAMRRSHKAIYWDDKAAVLVVNKPEYAEVIEANDASLTYYQWFLSGLNPETVDAVMGELVARIKAGDESAYVLYEMGACHHLKGEYAAARGYLTGALGARPNFAAAQHLLGDIHLALGEEDKAIEFYALAVENDPGDAMAYLRLGTLLLRRADWGAGLRCLRRAQEVDDRTGQLDRIRPGLRKELDRELKRIITPEPPPQQGTPQDTPEQGTPEQDMPEQGAPQEGAGDADGAPDDPSTGAAATELKRLEVRNGVS